MSPTSCDRTVVDNVTPLYASTPYSRPRVNGHDATDSTVTDGDVVNGNVHVKIISESINSMDVLSGGESDAGDTLSRRNNNNSISSGMLGTLKESASELPRRRNCDITYFVAKELLMTERTYKRDLELVTVSWSGCVSVLGRCGAAAALARGPLALEALVLRAGHALHALDRLLAHNNNDNDTEEPEYRKISELLYDYLSSIVDAYVSYSNKAAALVGLVESVRRGGGAAQQAAARFESAAPLSLACLLLRPLHRALHLHALAKELEINEGSEAASNAVGVWEPAVLAAAEHLPHVENHAVLCHLQRDIAGYDKLLVADREFLRLGCLYKHSSKGLQQRMLFLFSDVLVVTSKSGAGQFRAHAALALHTLQFRTSTMPNSFALIDPEHSELVLSAYNEREYQGWCASLRDAIAAAAAAPPAALDTQLTSTDHIEEGVGPSSGSLSHVCWHRGTSLDRDQLHLAMRSQLSGYLLRKFKKSPGWQKLWVVFAAFTLFFYKSWQDDAPLASLPLLGYTVDVPSPEDGIDKEFVFKLQFKNHVYFFRADGNYTYNRWTEVLRTAMSQHSK